MEVTQENRPAVISRKTPPESDPTKIDRNLPAGTPASLGTESVRGSDRVVEGLDEEGPPLAGN
jgi:hypothetical protein